MEFAGKGDDLSDANAKGNTEVTVERKTARLGMPTFLRTPANSDQGDGDAICYDCTPVSPHDNEKEKGPADKLVIPSHIVEIKEGETIVYIIGTRDGKVTKIEGLEIAKDTLEIVILRSCLISSISGAKSLINLTKLELYDNQIEEIDGIGALKRLKILDLSFNVIRTMSAVSECPLLEELYIAQNKLRKIEGLQTLLQLKILDLGANRIRKIECLENNTALHSLWLGKNKIEEIEGLENLINLRQLDIQSNRLRSIGNGLSELRNLSELYLASNQIENLNGLPLFKVENKEMKDSHQDWPLCNNTLSTIDLSNNKLCSIGGVELMLGLEELWMSGSLIDTYESLSPLFKLPKLTCIYLEHSPIAKDFEYRKKLMQLIPTLEQLDATLVYRNIG